VEQTTRLSYQVTKRCRCIVGQAHSHSCSARVELVPNLWERRCIAMGRKAALGISA